MFVIRSLGVDFSIVELWILDCSVLRRDVVTKRFLLNWKEVLFAVSPSRIYYCALSRFDKFTGFAKDGDTIVKDRDHNGVSNGFSKRKVADERGNNCCCRAYECTLKR